VSTFPSHAKDEKKNVDKLEEKREILDEWCKLRLYGYYNIRVEPNQISQF